MEGDDQWRNHFAFKGWLLFFFKLPSKPVNNRMKIWRKLNRAGAILFKGTVYLLPDNADNRECFEWLGEEISALGGESAMVKTGKIETMEQRDVVDLFNQQREKEYQSIYHKTEDLEKITASIQKGGSRSELKAAETLFKKARKEFDEIDATDFFRSKSGQTLSRILDNLEITIEESFRQNNNPPSLTITLHSIDTFNGKTWITRPNPFVDRMASAWLIRRYIDPAATFVFKEESEPQIENGIYFDMPNADFTHIGNLCTFEVLLKSFNLTEKPLKKIAEIVHDLDIKDDKYTPAEATGIETILTGIRASTIGDSEALEKGIAVFELLYTSNRL